MRFYIWFLVILGGVLMAQTEEFEIVAKRPKVRYEAGITAFTLLKPIFSYQFDGSFPRMFATYSPGLYISVGKSNHQFRVSLNYNRRTADNGLKNKVLSPSSSNIVLYSETQGEMRLSYLTIGNTNKFISPMFSCDLIIGVLQNKSTGFGAYYYYYGAQTGTFFQYGTGLNLGIQFNCTSKLNLKLESGMEYSLIRMIGNYVAGPFSSAGYRGAFTRLRICNITCGYKL